MVKRMRFIALKNMSSGGIGNILWKYEASSYDEEKMDLYCWLKDYNGYRGG